MKINPIIPIWLMAIICVVLLLLKRRGWLSYLRQILIIILLFAINLRVMILDENAIVEVPKIDAYVVLAIDTSLSMLANDMDDDGKTRLEAMNEDCEYIIDGLSGASFSVVRFDSEGYISCPYTDSPGYVKSIISAIYPIDEAFAQGSTLNSAYDIVEDQLKVTDDFDEVNTYVFILSDGEMNKGDDLRPFSKLRKYVDGGAVLGYGTSDGGTMQYLDPYWSDRWVIKDSNGNDAISRIDESNLKEIASDLEVDYVHMRKSSDLDEVIESIKDNVIITEEEQTEKVYKETYFYFLPPLIGLLIWDYIQMKRKVY